MAERQQGIIKSGSTEAKAYPESDGNVSPDFKEGSGIISGESELSSSFLSDSDSKEAAEAIREKILELMRAKSTLYSKYYELKKKAVGEAGGLLKITHEQRREIEEKYDAERKREEAEIKGQIKDLEADLKGKFGFHRSSSPGGFQRSDRPTLPQVPAEPPPTEPPPTEPTSTEPTSTEPASTEPASTEPASTEPASTEPAPTEPASTEPAPIESAPTEPTPAEPAPTESIPAEPTPAEPPIAELAEQEPPVEGATVVEVERLEELPPVLKKVLEPEIVQNQEVKIDWGQLKKDVNERIKGGYPDTEGIISKIDTKLKGQESLGLLFDGSRLSAKDKVINVKPGDFQDSNRDIWFLGDVHGDYLGLRAAISYATQVSNKSNKTPSFFYLGDLFDRGPHGHLVMLELFNQVCDEQIDVGMVLGNHDEGLGRGENGNFTGMVEPAEFIDWLNREGNEEWSELGRVCIEFFETIPRAVFLPDGLMIAHGGVPHEDCQEGGLNWEMLNENSDCLQDFVWGRVHENKKLSYPNRASKGHQLGINAFNSFCEKTEEISEISVPVQRLLRGHDHFVDGHKWYDRYQEYGVLTLNTRCFHPDLRANKSQYLAVARWVDNQLPEVHRISVPAEVIDEIYHEEMTG